jgi:hypothetical protein
LVVLPQRDYKNHNVEEGPSAFWQVKVNVVVVICVSP